MKNAIFGFSVKDIVEISMLVAISILLDKFVKIPFGLTGGSINIAMVPLFVISLRHGWFKTLISCGVVFGFITCLLDDYGLFTYPLEYLIPFGSICLVSLLSKLILDQNKSVFIRMLIFSGISFAILVIRIIFASIDSVIFWEYTFDAALLYNIPYVLLSGVACIIVMCALLPVIDRLNNMFKTDYILSIEENN